MMTKSSPEQDKTENLKTEMRQKWDTGQKWDKMETETGQTQDKIWTVDKNETKVGIPTLTRSTDKIPDVDETDFARLHFL